MTIKPLSEVNVGDIELMHSGRLILFIRLTKIDSFCIEVEFITVGKNSFSKSEKYIWSTHQPCNII